MASVQIRYNGYPESLFIDVHTNDGKWATCTGQTCYSYSNEAIGSSETPANCDITGLSTNITYTIKMSITQPSGKYIYVKYGSGSFVLHSEALSVGTPLVLGDISGVTSVTISWYVTSAGTGDTQVGHVYAIEKKVDLAEAFSTADSKVTKIVKALSEVFQAVDSFIPRLILGEAFGIVDSIIRTGNEAIAETINVIDDWKAKLSFNEVFSIIDSLTKSASLAKSETFSVIDSWVSRIRLSETFQIVDSFARTISYYFTEALGITDSCKAGIVWVEEIKKTIDWILADDTGWFTGWFGGWFSGEAPWTEETKKTINWTEK